MRFFFKKSLQVLRTCPFDFLSITEICSFLDRGSKIILILIKFSFQQYLNCRDLNFYPTYENGYHGDFPRFWKSGILRPVDSFVVCTKIFQKVIGPYKSVKQEKTGTLLLLGLGLYSFHLFATYVCNVWPTWCVFTLFYRV